jgi:hypothetical protein
MYNRSSEASPLASALSFFSPIASLLLLSCTAPEFELTRPPPRARTSGCPSEAENSVFLPPTFNLLRLPLLQPTLVHSVAAEKPNRKIPQIYQAYPSPATHRASRLLLSTCLQSRRPRPSEHLRRHYRPSPTNKLTTRHPNAPLKTTSPCPHPLRTASLALSPFACSLDCIVCHSHLRCR